MEHPQALSVEAMKKQELDMLLTQSTPERREIYEKLRAREWFRNTDIELQKQLVSLPDTGKANHDAFLEDLADRSEQLANIKIERLIDLPRGNFLVVPKFEVSRVDQPNMRYTYEYASWRNGPLSGAKGMVFVEKDGKTTHFMLLKGDKFGSGKPQLQAFGGFYDKGQPGMHTITDTMITEVREELGRNDIEIKKFENLGRVETDAGMTNNAPELYAVTISADDLSKLTENPVNPDVYELKQGAVVFPMEQLPDVVMQNSDSYFLSTVARAWAKGIIAPPRALDGKCVGFSPN